MPTSTQAAFNLGLLYDSLGQKEDAKALYLRALRLNPGNEKAATNLRLLEQP